MPTEETTTAREETHTERSTEVLSGQEEARRSRVWNIIPIAVGVIIIVLLGFFAFDFLKKQLKTTGESVTTLNGRLEKVESDSTAFGKTTKETLGAAKDLFKEQGGSIEKLDGRVTAVEQAIETLKTQTAGAVQTANDAPRAIAVLGQEMKKELDNSVKNLGDELRKDAEEWKKKNSQPAQPAQTVASSVPPPTPIPASTQVQTPTFPTPPPPPPSVRTAYIPPHAPANQGGYSAGRAVTTGRWVQHLVQPGAESLPGFSGRDGRAGRIFIVQSAPTVLKEYNGVFNRRLISQTPVPASGDYKVWEETDRFTFTSEALLVVWEWKD